jgi:hypothetical protein
MIEMIRLRTWATPLTIGGFILMSATGVLMFFGWDRSLTAEAHKWFSLLFLTGVGGHIAANIRPFLNHLKSRWGKTSVATIAIVLAASFFSWGIITGPQLVRPVKQALVDAPLSALAGVTHTMPNALDKCGPRNRGCRWFCPWWELSHAMLHKPGYVALLGHLIGPFGRIEQNDIGRALPLNSSVARPPMASCISKMRR